MNPEDESHSDAPVVPDIRKRNPEQATDAGDPEVILEELRALRERLEDLEAVIGDGGSS